MDLKPLCQRVADRLGIDPLDIKFEEMIDDSGLYIKEEYVAINNKFENDYVEYHNRCRFVAFFIPFLNIK
ncbi:MAG TPA: hypothetical protein PLM63_04125 [bacterium]|nr:hypothetical protein [bacterium]